MEHLMSENYRLRQYFLSSQEVPSQSMMRNKMSESLAALYFNSMTPKLKVLAGLEPPLKGGGGEWYVPPEDILKSRTVLKPVKRKCLSKLNYLGIDEIGLKLVENRRKNMKLEEKRILSENDEKWRRLIEEKCEQIFRDCSVKETNKNRGKLREECNEFSNLYALTITNVEKVMFDAACSEINKVQNEASQKMQDKYQTLVTQQATEIYDKFTNKLEAEKLSIKEKYVETLARYRKELGETIHDLNVEKHVSIEQSRQFWECRRLACQVYVALKEREECNKDIKLTEHEHKKKVKVLSAEIANKQNEITTRQLKEKMQLEFELIWQKKVWHVLKYFRMYVSYCLSLMPAHADFFINMEKLMLLHMDEVLKAPSAKSIFKENESYEGPSPGVHPFYLFCDKNQRMEELSLKKDLCPKHCTSSASQMPVIVVNKRCMYSECDNFQQFSNKVKHYIHGERGDDMDFTDNHRYEYDVPIKYTSSQYLSELKLQSSLLQILHQRVPNTRDTSIECSVCKLPYCFCKRQEHDAKAKSDSQTTKVITRRTPARNISNANREYHTTEDTIETYLKFIEPKRCACVKTAKKHLEEHMPVYMQKELVFDAPKRLPSYETCSSATLKRMVKEAREGVDLPQAKDSARTRDVATQYKDEEYEALCTCFSDETIIKNDLIKTPTADLSKYYQPSQTATDFEFLDNFSSPTTYSVDSSVSSTAKGMARKRTLERMRQRARSLRSSINAVPELADIFGIVRSDGAGTHRLKLIKFLSEKSLLVEKDMTN